MYVSLFIRYHMISQCIFLCTPKLTPPTWSSALKQKKWKSNGRTWNKSHVCSVEMVRVCGVSLDNRQKKIKVAHTQLQSLGFRSWSRFLAVSLQVTWVINPAVGCHYFPPDLQLPPQLLRALLTNFCCLVNRGMMGVNSLPKAVTRQHCDWDLNPSPSVPASGMLTTRLPSHLITDKAFNGVCCFLCFICVLAFGWLL